MNITQYFFRAAFLFAASCSTSIAMAGDHAHDSQFSLRVELPSGAASCADHAQQLGASLTQLAHVQIAQAQCNAQNTFSDASGTFTTDTIILTYVSDRQVETEKTFYSSSSFIDIPNDFRSLFATYGACQSNIATQVQAFTTATGLPVFTAFCHRSSQFGDSGYILTLENFGRAPAHLYSYSIDPILQDDSAYVAPAVVKAVTGKGGTLVLTTPEHIFYYSAGPIWVTSMELGYFNTLSDCTSQLSAAAAIFTNAHGTNVTTFCAPFLDQQHARLKVIATDSERVSKFPSAPSAQYRGIADCLDDVPRVIANYRSRGISGGICVPKFGAINEYELELYVPKI